MSRYEPTGETAAGGLGEVVFCMDKNLDRKVAIKFGLATGEHRRLLDELAALQRIRSKHVVQVFDVDFFDPGARMGIVEEFIDGASLEPRLGKVAPDNEFVRLVYQLSRGLADIHAVGQIHRDIKPTNVLIDTEGILKIIDFNLSRPATEGHTRGFVGTPGYAAPEMYGRGRVPFSAKVDVYAMGVTSWNLLYGGNLPSDLDAEPPRADAWKAAGGGFGSLSGTLDGDLLRLLDACVSDDPNDRPTAAEVADRAARLLLRDRHRAFFALDSTRTGELRADNRRVRVSGKPLGNLIVDYDGLVFRVAEVEGEVWINNRAVRSGMLLSGCSVIAFGDPSRPPRERKFVTMDVSHPEVVL